MMMILKYKDNIQVKGLDVAFYDCNLSSYLAVMDRFRYEKVELKKTYYFLVFASGVSDL